MARAWSCQPALRATPHDSSSLRGEVRLARRISHPNVCRVYDIGEADGHQLLSMEYVDGEDLASLLRRIGRIPEDKHTIRDATCDPIAAEEGTLALLRAALVAPSSCREPRVGTARLIARAKEYLNGHYACRVRLTDVARYAGASQAHLTTALERQVYATFFAVGSLSS